METRMIKKIIFATLLAGFVVRGPVYAGDRNVAVVDDQTGHQLADATGALIVSKQAFNPADKISLWRREINKKTDQQGHFIIQDSDFTHPSRSGRASEASLYICKAGYWPSSDTIHAAMVYVSFLKPSDLQREYRLRKATPDEYLSQDYYRALSLCPESEEKKAFFEGGVPAIVKRFESRVFSNSPEEIIDALKEMSGSTILTSDGVHTGEIVAAAGKILAHGDPAVRRAACKFLSAYLETDLPPEIMRGLLLLLEDSSPEVRAAAGEALVIHGKEAVSSSRQSILTLLGRPEPGMRQLGVRVIATYSEHQRSERHLTGGDPDIVLLLRKLLFQTSDEKHINTLLSALGNLGYPEYFQDLEKLYTRPNPRIQENVIIMMRFKAPESERKKALSYFVRSLQSPDSDVRHAAVVGIDQLGDESSVEHLEIFLKTEKQPYLRNFTLKTISRLKEKK